MRLATGSFEPPTGSFRPVLLLGLLLGGAGLAAALALALRVVLPLASSCLQACASDPAMMAAVRTVAGLCIALMASGLVAGGVVLAGQLRATRRLVGQMDARSSRPPQRLARLATALGLGGLITYVVDPAPYAFCYGFLSPRVCVSSGLVWRLSNSELRAVLLHEGFHLHRRDPLKVLVSRVVAGILFLLPVAAELRDRFLVEKELAADAHVVRQTSPAALASAILKLYREPGRPPMETLAAAAVGPLNMMGERIRQLTRPSHGLGPVRLRRVAASLAIVAVIGLVSLGSAFAAEGTLPAGGDCCALGVCSTTID